MGEICLKYGVKVVADEIHADFVYPGYRHHVFETIRPEFADMTITCTAPTKTFNLAGLQISNVFISNTELRKKFKQELEKTGYSQPNIMGLVACKAAYRYGAQWLEDLNSYLVSNLALVRDFLAQELPSVRLVEPEGAYLLWLDFRALDLPDKAERPDSAEGWSLAQCRTHVRRRREGFQRINIGCPAATLQKALEAQKGFPLTVYSSRPGSLFSLHLIVSSR